MGALDGVDFKQKNPGKAVPNPRRYYVTRKGGYELLCTAICDAHRRFLYFDISQTASTHDSLAWAASPLGIRIEGGDLPRPFFLSGDNAFTEAPHMVTPVGDSDYDFYQSSNRMPIECGEMLGT